MKQQYDSKTRLTEQQKRQHFDQALVDAVSIISGQLSTAEIKIYTLVQKVADAISFAWASDAYVALYQKLFITQAALCELYFRYEETGDYQLCINPVSVRLLVVSQIDDCLSTRDVLALDDADRCLSPNTEFFSNLSNFFDIDAEGVKALMQKFWQDYTDFMQQSDAYAILELPTSATWLQIQRQFRLLASQYHPDKGGVNEKFVSIRAAYESLKKQRSSSPRVRPRH